MRAFIALELPKEIKTEISKTQKQLKRAGIKAGWVKPEIAHLTLTFLGSITPNKVRSIKKVLDEATGRTRPIRLHLVKVGCFPHPAKPRVVFVGLEGELEKLNTLVKKIEKKLKKEKIWFDKKPFSPHITLGRIKKKRNLTNDLKGVKAKRIEFTAKKITLNKSTLGSSGPTYTRLKTIELASLDIL